MSLPKGWIATSVGEIASVNPREFTSPVDDDDTVSFLPMPAIEETSGHLDLSQTRKWAEVRNGFTRFEEGDVLFAKITPSMENGKITVAQGLTGGRGAGTTELHVFRPTSGIQPGYLRYFLLQESVRRYARVRMTGTAGQLRVPASAMEGLTIPLPPLPEQRRIVEAIDTRFTCLDSAVTSLDRVRSSLTRYRRSVLNTAFSGRLVPTEELTTHDGIGGNPAREGLPPSWSVSPISDVLAPLSDGRILHHGWSPQCDSEPAGHEEWGALKTSAIQPLSFQPNQNKRLPENLRPRVHLAVTVGDILITCAGPRARCGIACMVRTESPKRFISGKMYRFRSRADTVDPRYLTAYLQAPLTQQIIDGMKTGISDSGLNLTHDRFLKLPVSLAPLPEQRRIVEAIETRFSVADEVLTEVQHGLERCVRLRESILKIAFEGRLAPQNPADESASLLLERIKRERSQQAPNGPSGRRGRRRTDNRGDS